MVTVKSNHTGLEHLDSPMFVNCSNKRLYPSGINHQLDECSAFYEAKHLSYT